MLGVGVARGAPMCQGSAVRGELQSAKFGGPAPVLLCCFSTQQSSLKMGLMSLSNHYRVQFGEKRKELENLANGLELWGCGKPTASRQIQLNHAAPPSRKFGVRKALLASTLHPYILPSGPIGIIPYQLPASRALDGTVWILHRRT